MCTSSPSAPTPPPIVPEAPGAPGAKLKNRSMMDRQRRASTLVTGEQGLTTPGNVAVKTLLGQ